MYGTSRVLPLNAQDIEWLGLLEGALVTATTAVDDGHLREVGRSRVPVHDLPHGRAAGHHPECNELMPLALLAELSMVAVAKSIPNRLRMPAPTAVA